MTGAAARDRWASVHAAVCRRLFEVCGARASTAADDGLAVLLASVAGQAAFCESLLFDVLPVREGIDRGALVDGDRDTASGVLGVLDELSSLADAALAAVLARVVVPRLLASVDAELEATDRGVDGPRARALALVARDLGDARGAIERCAERLLAVDGALDDALGACAKSERRLVRGGAVVGLVALDGRSGGLTAPVE